MPSNKKERSCPFSSATARRKKPKKSFCLDWAGEKKEQVNYGVGTVEECFYLRVAAH